MANEVDITITAKDLTGPAFASALMKMEMMKKAAKEVGKEFRDIGGFNFDITKATTSLNMLKAKLQSLGIADIADVNISQGKITTQLMMLKRIIQQQKISDLLDVNINMADLGNQLHKISGLRETIPVGFDVGTLAVPKNLPPVEVPIKFDLGPMPDFSVKGPFQVKNIGIDAATLASWAELNREVFRLHAGIGDLGPVVRATKDALMSGAASALSWGSAARVAWRDTNPFNGVITKMYETVGGLKPIVDDTTASVRRFGYWGGGLGVVLNAAQGKIQLFGGALTAMGVKGFPASVTGIHLLIDSIAELLAVGIPGFIALAAGLSGMTGTVLDISRSMMALWQTTHALNQNIYPLTGNMTKLEDALHSTTLGIFGDMMLIADRNTKNFTDIAGKAGTAIGGLSTRITMALTSGGFDKLLNEGPKDLAMIGNFAGDIFGVIANVIKAMPGYAQILMGGLEGLARGLQVITGSQIGQWFLSWGITAHGAILWLGLGATLAVKLGDALVALGAKFGLASAGALSFDAAQFGLGIRQMILGVGLLGGELVTLGAGEDIAAAGALAMGGAWSAIMAINPMVWVGILAVGIGALIYWLTRGKNATNQYTDAATKAFDAIPINQVGVTLAQSYSNTLGTIAHLQTSASISALIELQAINQLSKGHQALTTQQKANVAAAQATMQQYADQVALLPVLRNDQKAYNDLLKVSHGNLSMVTDAGISWSQWVSSSGSQRQQYIIEIQAQIAAQNALALGTGRAAAAQNAQTNIFMQETVPAMQKVTKAEDDLLNVVLSSRGAFNSFEQSIMGTTAHFVSPSGLADAFKLAKGNLSGLNEQSLAYSNTLYTIAIPNLQKMVDALDSQSISAASLTTAVATGAGQILQYSGKSTEARSVIVSLINNALGPGTVSLKTLDKWVGKNSTSLDGLNNIIAASTIKAGSLAGVLQNDLNVQFAQSLLKSSGAAKDISTFTDAITHGGTQTTTFHNARAQLIRDLETTGLSAHDATSMVDGLQRKIDGLHGKTVPVSVFATGAGGVQITDSMHKALIFKLTHFATGGKLPGFGGGDRNLALLEDGEAVVDKHKTKKYAPWLKAMGIPGMDSGGLVGLPPWTASGFGSLIGPQIGRDIQAMMNKEIATWHALPPSLPGIGLPVGITGPGGGSPAQNVALAQRILGWSGGEFADLVRLWNQESGWNQFAYNASSGATGIPQALPYTKMPRSAWLPSQGGSANVLAQETWGASYIRGRYGSPSSAWAHEQQFNWYDNGGWLRPGPNFMWNGTGRPEHLTRDSGSGIHITLELGESFRHAGLSEQQLRDIKYTVRTKGGGNVQQAFGKN